MRVRYQRRVTRADVGSRVSVRRWVDQPQGRPVRSDVVGRLVGWSDDDVLTVVRRDGSAVEVPNRDVVASRVVPPHPTLPPEPHTSRGGPQPGDHA